MNIPNRVSHRDWSPYSCRKRNIFKWKLILQYAIMHFSDIHKFIIVWVKEDKMTNTQWCKKLYALFSKNIKSSITFSAEYSSKIKSQLKIWSIPVKYFQISKENLVNHEQKIWKCQVKTKVPGTLIWTELQTGFKYVEQQAKSWLPGPGHKSCGPKIIIAS